VADAQPTDPRFPFSLTGRFDHSNQLPVQHLPRQAGKALSFGAMYGSNLPNLLDRLRGQNEPRWLRWVREGVPVVDRVASLEDPALAEEIARVDQYHESMRAIELTMKSMRDAGVSIDEDELERLRREVTVEQVETEQEGDTLKVTARYTMRTDDGPLKIEIGAL